MNVYESLPDYKDFCYEDAQKVARFIRSELRPNILKSLRTIYNQGTISQKETVKLLGLEIRLQQVDDYLSGLMSIIENEGMSISPHERTVELMNIETDGTHFINADTRLFFCPSNNECVHAPITLLFITTLVEKIMIPGEILTSLTKVTWWEPIRNNLKLFLFVDNEQNPLCLEKCSITGEFSTSIGRRLYFYGVQQEGSPVINDGGRNHYSQQFLKGTTIRYDHKDEVFRLEIHPSAIDWCREQKHLSLSAFVSTFLDIIDIGIINARRLQMRQLEYLPMLCIGKKNVFLPANMNDLLKIKNGPVLEIKLLKDKTHLSRNTGLRIIHYYYRFLPIQTTFSEVVFAETEDMRKMLRVLHSH